MKISLFIPSMEGGGAEKVILNLANGLSQFNGISVDLILSEAKGTYLNKISKNVRIIDMNNGRTIKSLFGLIKYLNNNSPDVLMSGITHANIVAVLAKVLAKKDIKVILTQHTVLSNSLKLSNKMFSALFLKLILIFYPLADRIVTVSKHIEQDLIKVLKISNNKVQTIYNPIMEDKIIEQSREPLNHNWFNNGSPPVVLSVGRLKKVKDYPTLLKSFKLLRNRMEAKLLILGEGELREDLIALSEELEIKEDVQMLGFVENPYKYMARAKVFALTSIYEGFGNVLVEALGCGTNVISTNCPGGVSEILDNGKYGTLVPVGDVEILSEELFKLLNNLHSVSPYDKLKRAEDFTVEKITKEYLAIIDDVVNKKSAS